MDSDHGEPRDRVDAEIQGDDPRLPWPVRAADVKPLHLHGPVPEVAEIVRLDVAACVADTPNLRSGRRHGEARWKPSLVREVF